MAVTAVTRRTQQVAPRRESLRHIQRQRGYTGKSRRTTPAFDGAVGEICALVAPSVTQVHDKLVLGAFAVLASLEQWRGAGGCSAEEHDNIRGSLHRGLAGVAPRCSRGERRRTSKEDGAESEEPRAPSEGQKWPKSPTDRLTCAKCADKTRVRRIVLPVQRSACVSDFTLSSELGPSNGESENC